MKSEKYDEIMSGLVVTDEMRERLMERLENEAAAGPETEYPTQGGTVYQFEEKSETEKTLEQKNSKNKKAIMSFAGRMGLATAACLLLVVGFSFGALISYQNNSSPKSPGDQAYYEPMYEEPDMDMESESMEEMADESGDVMENGAAPMTGNSYNKAATTENNKETGSLSDTVQTTNQKNGSKIVYTCELTIETEKYQESIKDLTRAIENKNGYIESEYEHEYNTYLDEKDEEKKLKSNELIIRIPKDQYKAFVAEAEQWGTITRKQQSAKNITRQYSDNEVKIKALKVQEKRLLAMMDQAETIQDMITVEDRLTEVQTELETYESYKTDMDDMVDYSTVTMELKEINEKAVPETPEDPNAMTNALIALMIMALIAAVCIFVGVMKKNKKKENNNE